MKRKLFSKGEKKENLIPEVSPHEHEKKPEKVRVTIFDYDDKDVEEKEVGNVETCFPYKTKPSVTWINVDGLHQPDIIKKMGDYFEIHPLVLESILDTNQRPKIEDLGNYIFICLKMITCSNTNGDIDVEHVSLVLGSNFVISFQEKPGDVFDTIRRNIRKHKGRIRAMGPDYLVYSLIDAIIDHYFTIVEIFGEKTEDMEDELILNPLPPILHRLHKMKKDMLFLRKSVWPLREVVNSLARGETKLIKKSTRIYLRDVYDHTIQIIDTIETMRDMASGMLEIYLSSLSYKMNEVMKVLTIIATIFIPLTFIAGVYGMNFEYMPELKWSFGYFTIWGVMASVVIVMLIYFKRKKWI